MMSSKTSLFTIIYQASSNAINASSKDFEINSYLSHLYIIVIIFLPCHQKHHSEEISSPV